MVKLCIIFDGTETELSMILHVPDNPIRGINPLFAL
jgi:hypothetical protein